jgi:hypothetical protein
MCYMANMHSHQARHACDISTVVQFKTLTKVPVYVGTQHKHVPWLPCTCSTTAVLQYCIMMARSPGPLYWSPIIQKPIRVCLALTVTDTLMTSCCMPCRCPILA